MWRRERCGEMEFLGDNCNESFPAPSPGYWEVRCSPPVYIRQPSPNHSPAAGQVRSEGPMRSQCWTWLHLTSWHLFGKNYLSRRRGIFCLEVFSLCFSLERERWLNLSSGGKYSNAFFQSINKRKQIGSARPDPRTSSALHSINWTLGWELKIILFWYFD